MTIISGLKKQKKEAKLFSKAELYVYVDDAAIVANKDFIITGENWI